LTIYDIFKALNRQLGITILIVSHDPGIARHVDRVVAIRDGKLATETVRRTGGKNTKSTQGETEIDAEAEFEEMTVLDSAGRLQLPKDYLEQLAIQKRVRMELLEDGIMIRPVINTKDAQASSPTAPTYQTPPDQQDLILEDQDVGFLRKTINRMRFIRSKVHSPDTAIEGDKPQEDET